MVAPVLLKANVPRVSAKAVPGCADVDAPVPLPAEAKLVPAGNGWGRLLRVLVGVAPTDAGLRVPGWLSPAHL